jgi:uncharacterized phage protein (TIGR02218 family)
VTYSAQETSLESGQPIELFEFHVSGEFFRYTNGETTQTRLGADFLPAAISRSNIKRSGPKFEAEVEIQASLNDDTIRNFLLQWAQISPEGLATVKIYEKHLTDLTEEYRVIFAGDMQSVRFDEMQARMLVKTIGDMLTREGPKDTWGGPCENQFGDDYCQVVLSTVQKDLNLTTLGGDGITLTFNTLGDGRLDGDYVGGYVKLVSKPFDFRFIVTHVGDVVTLQQPFASIAAGDLCQIVEGCHHTLEDCDTRFANSLEYGGTPFTPRDNPFTTDLNKI